MYIIKLKVEDFGAEVTKIYAVKDKATLDIIKDNNYRMFLDDDEDLKDAMVYDEDSLFSESNCGILQMA